MGLSPFLCDGVLSFQVNVKSMSGFRSNWLLPRGGDGRGVYGLMTNGLGRNVHETVLCFYSSYAFRKSSLEIPDCESIVRNVELLSVR